MSNNLSRRLDRLDDGGIGRLSIRSMTNEQLERAIARLSPGGAELTDDPEIDDLLMRVIAGERALSCARAAQ